MKVPIEEIGEDRDEKSPTEKTEAPTAADKPGTASGMHPDDDAAMREAARRAAEEVLREEAAEEAEKAKSERNELKQQVDDLTNEVEKAKKEAADATDRMKRLQADWDNFRRRTAQERLDERERAAEKLVLGLLPVIDDMERAVEHASKVDGDNEQFKQFVDGVQAVHDKMVSVLSKDGVEVIDPAGQPFDPLEHQAVGRSEDADAYDETVAQVYQKGYRMGGKVIRNAMVTVTYGGPKRPASDEAGDGTGAEGANDK